MTSSLDWQQSATVHRKSIKRTAFYRKIFQPEVVFTIAAVQALLPYPIWYFFGPYKELPYQPTYLPAVIWLIGWISFQLGCLFVRRPLPSGPKFSMRRSQTSVSLLLLVGILCLLLQIAGAVRVYGSFPLLSYLRADGAIDVNIANDLQEQSALGQFGLMVSSLEIATAFLLGLLLSSYATGKKSGFLTSIALIVLSITHLINGKRGGIIMTLFVLVCGVSLYCGSFPQAIVRMIPIPRSKFAGRALILTAVGIMLYLFGFLATIRNQSRMQLSSFEQISLYLQYPLANMELQCVTAGLGPREFFPFLPLRDLVPYKWAKGTEMLDLTRPPRVERTAPAGLYELIQWSWGIWGVILFSLLLGCFTRYFYNRSLDNPYILFAYCQLAFSLFITHSFNQFLILSYIPFPLFLYWICYTVRLIPYDRVSQFPNEAMVKSARSYRLAANKWL